MRPVARRARVFERKVLVERFSGLWQRVAVGTAAAGAVLVALPGHVFAASPDPVLVSTLASVGDSISADVGVAMPIVGAALVLGIGITLLIKLGKKAPRAI
jgi:hypothetical protein